MATQSAALESLLPIRLGGLHRLDLQFVRASALAQTRLQLAVLSGNRRRALEQIDQQARLAARQPRAVHRGWPSSARTYCRPSGATSRTVRVPGRRSIRLRRRKVRRWFSWAKTARSLRIAAGWVVVYSVGSLLVAATQKGICAIALGDR